MQGAADAGAEVEMVRLYDDAFKGCVSCFTCKLKNAKTNGLCAYKAALTPILEKAWEVDVLVMGNPIYFSHHTGPVRSFMERLMFLVLTYNTKVDSETGAIKSTILNKTLTHPCIISAILGILLMATQISLPGWLRQPLEMVSSRNTVLSLLVIGGVLAELNPKKVLNKQAVLYSLVRLVLISLAVFGICLLLKLEYLVTACSVVMVGIPVPLILAMLANQYNKDEKFAVSLIFLSTLLSMFTIPMLSMLISAVL